MAQRRAHRPWAPSVVAVTTTAGLVAVLGSEQLIDRADEADRSLRPLLAALTGLPAWATARLPAHLEWALAAKLATLLLAVGLLARFVAAAGSRVAAFLAGWAALVLSGALAALVFLQLADLVPTTTNGPTHGFAAAVRAVNTGASFGLYTGWLVGLAVALAMTPASRPTASGRASAASAPASTSNGSQPKVKAKANGSQPPAPSSPNGSPQPVATWPPRPRIGTVLPNPAWTAAGLHQESADRPKADAT